MAKEALTVIRSEFLRHLLAVMGGVAVLWMLLSVFSRWIDASGTLLEGLHLLFMGWGIGFLCLLLWRQHEVIARQSGLFREQREALLALREEMIDQREALRGQLGALDRQRFESRYYHHLAALRGIAEHLEYARSGVRETGRRAFQSAWEEYRGLYETGNQFRKHADPERIVDSFHAYREHIFDPVFTGYMQCLRDLVGMLENPGLSSTDRLYLARLIFHEMTLPELLLVKYFAFASGEQEATLAAAARLVEVPPARLLKPEHRDYFQP